MPAGLADELALALRLADIADRMTLARFRATDLVVETKPDLTPVSEADRDVETAIRDVLASERPGHGVVGEEHGVEAGDGEHRWILDPIDGTRNYVRGVPVWASLLALERAGELVVGVASAPALGRRWWASTGGGAFADGVGIRVSKVRSMGDAVVSSAGQPRPLLPLLEACHRRRGFGDFWQHCLVAEGAIDVAVDPEVTLWDLAALVPIVREAGGRLTTLDGDDDPAGGSGVSTNGLLHDEVVNLLGSG